MAVLPSSILGLLLMAMIFIFYSYLSSIKRYNGQKTGISRVPKKSTNRFKGTPSVR